MKTQTFDAHPACSGPAFFRSAFFMLSLLTVALLLYPLGLAAQTGRTNAGTLTCTLDPGDAGETGEPRSVSCVFDQVSQQAANFSGTLEQLSDTAPTADRLVLVWTVLAPSAEIDPSALEGRYISAQDSGAADAVEPDGRLIGGADAAIELQPLVDIPDTVPEDALLVLELDLTYLRA